MSPKDRNLVIVGVIICLVIACLSPFIASSNPDGLEKSAEDVSVGEVEPAYQSPFPDYSIEGLETIGEIAALALGIIVTLIIAWIAAILIKRRQPPQVSK